MSWSAHLQHTDTGLAIVFAGPVSRLDLTPDVAEHFASLIAIEARQRMLCVVAAVAKTEELRGSGRWGQNLNGSELRATVEQTHALCCDCDPCLNGDQDG